MGLLDDLLAVQERVNLLPQPELPVVSPAWLERWKAEHPHAFDPTTGPLWSDVLREAGQRPMPPVHPCRSTVFDVPDAPVKVRDAFEQVEADRARYEDAGIDYAEVMTDADPRPVKLLPVCTCEYSVTPRVPSRRIRRCAACAHGLGPDYDPASV